MRGVEEERRCERRSGEGWGGQTLCDDVIVPVELRYKVTV